MRRQRGYLSKQKGIASERGKALLIALLWLGERVMCRTKEVEGGVGRMESLYFCADGRLLNTVSPTCTLHNPTGQRNNVPRHQHVKHRPRKETHLKLDPIRRVRVVPGRDVPEVASTHSSLTHSISIQDEYPKHQSEPSS